MRLRFGLMLVAVVAFCFRTAEAQQFVSRTFQDDAGTHKYSVFVPAGYTPQRRWPAILFLHGAGERGTDGVKPTLVGLGPYAKARGAAFPFLVVFPQVEDPRGRITTAWQAGEPAAERALKILDEVQRSYAVDAKRVALVGWSMGGYGAWSLGAAHPDRWSAVVPISGGGNTDAVAGLKTVPVWAFHGVGDRLVPVSATRQMVDALKAAGGNITYTELDDAVHDLSQQVFGNDGFVKWLLDPKQPAQLAATSQPLTVEPPPFAPAVEIPQAVGIRLGNDALRALSYAAPQMVPPGMLTGRLNDMFDGTVVQGRSFSIRFSGISYSGKLERVVLQAAGPDRVTVQMGLRNVLLTIAGTSISGARQSAYAGPINIGIGHNRAVWLNLVVSPYVENQRLRLRAVSSSFSIPPDNFYVTQPAGVSVQGFGMTQDRVSSGLVSGLYGARGRIENEVRAIVPNIVQQLENQLRLTDAGPIVAGMWPLPVYEPRLKALPEAVTTDADGISIVLGLSAASPDLSVPRGQPAKAAPAGVSLQALGSGKALGVAVAPQVFEPLSKLLIDADLAGIDVLDIPEPSMHRFADRKVLAELLPDLNRFDDSLQVRSELVLAAPLTVQRAADAGNGNGENAVPLEFQLPGVRIDVSVKPAGQPQWQKYASLSLDIKQQVQAELQKPSHERRTLELNWTDARSVNGSGRFADGVQPQDATVNVERFVELFREAWRQWTASGPAAAADIPDVAFATTKLRIDRLGSEGNLLTGTFVIPTVKLSNSSTENFVYETKGPYSGWGGPYTLEPGKSHDFEIPYPLTYRRRTAAYTEVYTLYPGSHSEFTVPKSGGPPRLFQAVK